MTLTFLSQTRRSLTFREILPLLEQIVKAGKKLLIIAEDVEGEALFNSYRKQAERYFHLRSCRRLLALATEERKCFRISLSLQAVR